MPTIPRQRGTLEAPCLVVGVADPQRGSSVPEIFGPHNLRPNGFDPERLSDLLSRGLYCISVCHDFHWRIYGRGRGGG